MEQRQNVLKSRGFWITSIVGVLLFILLGSLVDMEKLHSQAEDLPGFWVVVLLCILPLLGVPATFLYVVAGAKFGPVWGMVWAVFSIAINLAITYWLTHTFLHDPIQRFFAKTRYRLPKVPEGESVSICLLTALVPGLPYAVKNYLLVLTGVRWKPYFFACWPAHSVHASLGIFFGHITGELTPTRVTILVVYAVVLSLLSRHVVKRMKARAGQETPAPQVEQRA